MSYQEEGGRVVPQKGLNGAAYVIVVGTDGLPTSGLAAVINAIKSPSYSEVSVITVATSGATGTTFVPFASKACAFIDVVNNTGADIQYQRNGAGEYIVIPTGASRYIEGITNANQIGVRRADLTTTQVTVRAEAFVL